MQLWIVKINGNVVTKPLTIEQAAKTATVFVDVAESFCNITIEFYAQEF